MVMLRLATMDDADKLARLAGFVQRLHAEALPHMFKPAGDLAAITADMRTRILADQLSVVYIAEVDGLPVGYVVCIFQDRPENAYTYARRTLFIDQIGVAPAYQRQGVGRALINAVVERAQAENCQFVSLTTWAFNQNAHRFFEEQGFAFAMHRMDVYLSRETVTGMEQL